MKKFRKRFSVLLILALTLALALPAYAAAETGAITVEPAKQEAVYKAYKVFDLVKNGEAYAYTVSEGWDTFFTGAGASYVNVDPVNGLVSFKFPEGSSANDAAQQKFVADFAQAAKTWAEANVSSKAVEPTSQANHDPADGFKTVVFDNLPMGYWLVTTTHGALCILDHPGVSTTVAEKNKAPVMEKEAVSVPTAGIGTNIPFKITLTMGSDGLTKYTVQDTMNGLRLIGSDVTGSTGTKEAVKVTASKTSATGLSTLTEGTHYTVTASYDSAQKKSSLTVELDDTNLVNKLSAGDTLTLEYQAEVVNYENVNNKAEMQYQNGVNVFETPVEIVTTPSYSFTLQKYAVSGEDEIPLEATFRLYTDSATAEKVAKNPEDTAKDNNLVKFIKSGSDYIVASSLDTPALQDLTIDGQNLLKGLDAKTYYLVEMSAPAGYNRLVKPVKIVIAAGSPAVKDGEIQNPTITVDFDPATEDVDTTLTDGSYVLKVENKSGVQMPTTGGIGTTIFYVVGGLLMVAALVLLITKRKMNQK